MFDTQVKASEADQERRRYPRYPVLERINLAVEDESIGESIGIGEAADISLGGLRVRDLPKNTMVRAGDRLGLLLIAEEQALSLRGEVVHHGTADSFGIEFREISQAGRQGISQLLERMHS